MNDDFNYEPDLTVRQGGGFHGDATYTRMSPQARQNVQRSLYEEEVRNREAEQERQQRGAVFEHNSIFASIEAAAARGEHVDARTVWRDGGIGRSHRDVLIAASDQMDLEDRREQARRAREGVHMTDLDWSAMHSADTSAPDTISDEGQARAARMAEAEEGGRRLHQNRRFVRQGLEDEIRDLRSRVQHLTRRYNLAEARAAGRGLR